MIKDIPPGLLWSILIAIVGASVWLGQQQGSLSQRVASLEEEVEQIEARRDSLTRLVADVEHIKRQLDRLSDAISWVPMYGEEEPR